MRKTIRIVAIAATAILASATASFAQETATATATATIVTPLSIIKEVDMNFGTVAVNATTGGTVVLATDGTRSATGGVSLPVSAIVVGEAARFLVTGHDDYTYAITLPSADHTISNGANNMTVNAFVSDPLTDAGKLSAGQEVVHVGATLNVAAAQATGVYISTTPFEVTVNYN